MLKKWQKRLKPLIERLGFKDKVKQGKLSADEQKQLYAEYEKEYGVSFSADKEANEDAEPDPAPVPELSAEDQQQLAAMFGEDAPKTVPAMTQKIVEQQQTIQTLEQLPESTAPVTTVALGANQGNPSANVLSITLGRVAHTPTHLFGIEDPMMSRGNWYVDLTINKTPVVEKLTPDQKESFMKAFNSFSQQLVLRSAELSEKNMVGLLNYQKMISGESNIDYSDLFGKAGEYIVRRTDIILAYLRSLPSVSNIFPMRSNIQNKEVAPGANFGELSQGYRPGKIFKGNVRFTAEIYKVVDVMFKFLFQDLIKLEKQYIGYLNKEGSDVIKWTFIEWIMVHFGEILKNEQNRRRVVGVRTPQQNVVANPAMLAADGVYQAVDLVEEDYKVFPNPDYGVYTESTIGDYFESFWDFHTQILDSLVGWKLYANGKHKAWYTRWFRNKYGRDTDFSGVTPDTIADVDANIIWVPNLPANNYKVILTIPGNLENHEDKPNEMFAFYFERDWESIGVMSRWKEGAGAQQAGIQYKTLKELKASEYVNQWIFTNDPVTELAADASVVNAKLNSYFKTGANTAATEITNIDKLPAERVCKIICGDLNNPTQIKKAGKFAKISADWVPTAVGDFIWLYNELEDYQETIDGESVTMTRPTGNYLELRRRVS